MPRISQLNQASKTALSSAVGLSASLPAGAVSRRPADKLADFVSVLDFMSDEKRADVLARTELYDHSAEILAAAQYAIANGKRLRAPAGTYMFGGTRLAPTVTDGCSFHLEGDGMGATIIKETDGLTSAVGRFNMMWYFNVPNGSTMRALSVSNLTLDKNGATSPPTDPVGDPYAYEQSHAISVTANETGDLLNAKFQNVEVLGKTAGGIVLAAGRMRKVEIENCHGRDWPGVGGERGDFEFQASIDSLIVHGCTGSYSQCEPNASSPVGGVRPNAVFDACDFERVEFEGYAESPFAQTVEFNNSKASKNCIVRSVTFKAWASQLTVEGGTKYWSRTGPGSVLDDCTLTVKYDGETDSVSPFYPRSEATGGGTYLKVRGGSIIPGDGASETTTGYAVSNAATYSGAQPYLVEFESVEFSPLFQYNLNAYRNGAFVLRRCKLSGRDWCVRVGSLSPNYGGVVIDDCDTSGVLGSLIRAVANDSLAALEFRGCHDYSDFSVSVEAGTIGNIEANFKPRGAFISDAVPAGAGIKGQRVSVLSPSSGSPADYICTASSATAATWKSINSVA